MSVNTSLRTILIVSHLVESLWEHDSYEISWKWLCLKYLHNVDFIPFQVDRNRLSTCPQSEMSKLPISNRMFKRVLIPSEQNLHLHVSMILVFEVVLLKNFGTLVYEVLLLF